MSGSSGYGPGPAPGGGGGISGLTTNTLPKATSSTTLGDSAFTDDGTGAGATVRIYGSSAEMDSPDVNSIVSVQNNNAVLIAGNGTIYTAVNCTPDTLTLDDGVKTLVQTGGVLNLGSATGSVAAGWFNVSGGFAVNGTPVGGGALQSATVNLNDTQLGSLNSSPVQLIAAPGAGNVINVVNAVLQYIKGTTVFTGVFDDISVVYPGTPIHVLAPFASFLPETTAFTNSPGSLNYLGPFVPISVAANSAVQLASASDAGVTTPGTGRATVTVYYTVVPELT